MCNFPYLRNWSETNDLLSCVTFLQKEFSRAPPLYASKSVPAPKPSRPSVPPSSATRSPAGPPPAAPVPIPQRSSSLPSKDVTPKQLMERYLQTILPAYYQQTAKDIDREFSHQRKLARHHDRITETIDALRTRKLELDRRKTVVRDALPRLDSAIREMEQESDTSSVQVVADSPLQQQLVDVVAEDAAISDVLYQLSRAFERDHVQTDEFLKTTRMLAREQFFSRALARKIEAALQQQ
mmetsp:Transcript_30085/g.75728  ORF Transcript_30085/g.75728 Transcript_30085/m.75728 type:complete len:239 (+) Transcript_30085:564-1280(+)